MKLSINSFKTFVKKAVTIFSSREFAFIYAVLGSLSLVAHCYYLVASVSSFTGAFKVIQAVALSTFISTSLLYFVSIADKDDDPKEYKRVMRGVNLFMYIEIAMNLYYYCRHLIIDVPEMRIFDFIFGGLISCLIPITIKLYANSIKAKQWLKEVEEKSSTEPISINIDQLIESKINQIDIESIVKDKVQSYIPSENQSIDISEIKSQLQGEIETIVKNKIQSEIESIKDDLKSTAASIDIKDIDKFYRKDIESKISEITERNNREFYTNIENNIKTAIEKYIQK